MSLSSTNLPRSYLIAVAGVSLATAIRVALHPLLGDRFLFFAFFVAIVYAAWYGGFGPAILSVCLSLLAIDRFLLVSRGPVPIFGDRWQMALAFFTVSVAVALLGEALRAARRHARASDSETRRLLEEQQADRERLRTTLASIADAVITTDPEGRITLLNPAAERLTGWGAVEATGHPLGEVFRIVESATDASAVLPIVNDVPEVEAVLSDDHKLVLARDGEARWVEHNSAPITNEWGSVNGTVIVLRDITERKRAEAALRESEQRFARFMQHLPGLAWIKDVEGRYVYANDAAERVFRTARAQLYGRTDEEVFPPETAAQFREHDRRARAAGAGVQLIETLEHEDGVLHHSLVSKFPIPGADGRTTLVGGMAIDITDRMEMEAALREADRRKDEFLATLAHELRNPLAPIRNALSLMRYSGGSGADFEAARSMAERQVIHLTRLVDDLMDIARISRGKIELRKEPLELAPIVRRAVEALQFMIEGRGHALSVSLPSEPIRLEADPTRLEQVLFNILLNAAKYTEPGGRIRLEGRRVEGEVVIRVRDTGIGIEPEMLPRIFEMFTQVDHRSTRSQGGLGIGLGLIKSLVELHGGTITADSDGPGTGSEFVVRLPALPAGWETPAVAAPGFGTTPALGPPRRILVVDDNADAALSLAKLLRRLYGQEVRVAHDGPEALDIAEEFRPEVVLLDLAMPAMDGYEVARRLRDRPALAGTMLVALTGWGQESDRQESREAGFDRHLVKPVDLEEIRGADDRHGADRLSRLRHRGPGGDRVIRRLIHVPDSTGHVDEYLVPFLVRALTARAGRLAVRRCVRDLPAGWGSCSPSEPQPRVRTQINKS